MSLHARLIQVLYTVCFACIVVPITSNFVIDEFLIESLNDSIIHFFTLESPLGYFDFCHVPTLIL